MNFKKIAEAGLTYEDAAYILGVSKVTIYKYLKRGATPSPSHQPRTTLFLELLDKLLTAQKLPYRMGAMPKPDRAAKRRAIADKIKGKLDQLTSR